MSMLNQVTENAKEMKVNSASSMYNDDCVRLEESKQTQYIFIDGKLKGKKCVKASIDDYNNAKGTNLDPSRNHVCFYTLDDKENKETIFRVLVKDFVRLTELVSNSSNLCKKCGHRIATDESISYIKQNVFNNPNIPSDVITQIEAISKEGHICYQCQRFMYLGEYMKLGDIVKRVNAKARLTKKLETKDMPKCSKCNCLLDNEEVELNKAFGKEDKMLCSIHLLEEVK